MSLSLSPHPQPPSLLHSSFGFAWELIKVVVLALAIIIPVRYFLIQPFYVKGASMEPTYYDHEYLVIDELTYRFHPPARGQVVVFRYPLDPQDFFIKRIIGLPGETVELDGRQVKIYNAEHPQGFVLQEPYVQVHPDVRLLERETVRVGADEYFVMGDNRAESKDSRVFGPVKRHFITGRVLVRGWPITRIGVMTGVPEYGL